MSNAGQILLFGMDQTNMEKIREIYHWMTPIMKEFIDLDKNMTRQYYNNFCVIINCCYILF